MMTNDKVRDIKMMLIYSGLTQTEIAKYHGIAPGKVSAIKTGDLYREVDLL